MPVSGIRLEGRDGEGRRNPLGRASPPWRDGLRGTGLLAALALLTFLVEGYHPLAEDGGLYVAGVEITLHPALFPHDTAFVREHLRFSLFAPLLAGCVHLLHLGLAGVLLLVDLLSLLLLFFAGRQILRRCGFSTSAQLCGLALLAVWATLPIAGTSLLLVDPYVTARSLSTPLSLSAVAFAMDRWDRSRSGQRSLWACVALLLLAAAFHPLMAGYAAALVVCQRLVRRPRPLPGFAVLVAATVLLSGALQALAPPEPPAVVAAAYSRYYWFLSQWQWYERLGLAGPLAILLLVGAGRWPAAYRPAAGALLARSRLCSAGIALGGIAILVALLFAREALHTHLVARLQPLRVFLLLYALMALLLGAWVAELLPQALAAWFRRHRPGRLLPRALLPALATAVFGCVMFWVQRQTFPASEHLELPYRAARNPNPWTQAFLWARNNTPGNALFALDARYVNEDGEDAQTFRATALRSALPDFSKDGGEAAITPSLAAQWQKGAAAQAGLSDETDAVRDARLLPLHVTWMVLHTSSPTGHPCPYRNRTVKVCRLVP